jgi:hypothetical protein
MSIVYRLADNAAVVMEIKSIDVITDRRHGPEVRLTGTVRGAPGLRCLYLPIVCMRQIEVGGGVRCVAADGATFYQLGADRRVWTVTRERVPGYPPRHVLSPAVAATTTLRPVWSAVPSHFAAATSGA